MTQQSAPKHKFRPLKSHRLGMPEGVVLCVRNKLECMELCLVMSGELRSAVLGAAGQINIEGS